MGRLKKIAKALIGQKAINKWRMRGQAASSSPEVIFTQYYQTNYWGNAESLSGPGSSDEETARVRSLIIQLVRELDVKVFLDVPCGDFAWMSKVDLGKTRYIGGDIVRPLIENCQAVYGNEFRDFVYCDLITGPVPEADLIMCRDCLFHLSLQDAQSAIGNIKNSGSTYLLATTHPGTPENMPILTGGYRPLDLRLSPFSFPKPLKLLMERPDAGFADTNKSLGLWRIADL